MAASTPLADQLAQAGLVVYYSQEAILGGEQTIREVLTTGLNLAKEIAGAMVTRDAEVRTRADAQELRLLEVRQAHELRMEELRQAHVRAMAEVEQRRTSLT